MLLLLLIAVALINYSPVQSYIAKRAAAVLSGKLKTRVEVGHLHVALLNTLDVGNVYIEDRSGDTLLYAGSLQVSITDWFIFKEKPVLHYLGLSHGFVHLYRKGASSEWNYHFIEEAFSSTSPKDTTKKNAQIQLDLRKIAIDDVRFHMDDNWIGEDLDFDIGNLLVNARDVDYKKKLIDIRNIDIIGSTVSVNEYKGTRPRHLRPKNLNVFDTTAFNSDDWQVRIHQLTMKASRFALEADTDVPPQGLFDEDHIRVNNINADVTDVSIIKDTIFGTVNDLNAMERSGLAIKHMRSKVSVSPVASICKDLYLETNNSVLRDYYAMRYKHFPNFLDYIDSVTMEASLDGARIDKRDIEFFAPEMQDFPDMVVTASGHGKGTVADITATNLRLSDGKTSLSGDLTMKGLPDIYSTFITFHNGEIVTNGQGIMRYAPELRNNEHIAADSIKWARYKGEFEGYVEEFKINGTFSSNLGLVGTALSMSIPGFKADSARYTGVISTEKFNIGVLLRQPLFGTLTMTEQITGTSFSSETVQMYGEGMIRELGVNGYDYHNITTKGTLARKQFDGKLLVDDPNLALDFNGRFNYRDKLFKIDATAHLLNSDFRALNIANDDITASSDFDLNWVGSNIDDFSGYAKLFNIDLRRSARRLAIDSLYLVSSLENGNRQLDLTSDAFTISMDGNFRISNLPASVQYYLSRYIPSYIKAPSKYAPDQNFTFRITTQSVDSIFAVSFPTIRGFDEAIISGSLNTTNKKLYLEAEVPYGSIGKVQMNNISVIGEGNLDNLGINANVDKVVFGDSALNGELSLTATVGNDSVDFSIGTMSPSQESSLNLNGNAVARNDTLTLSIAPSRFSLNKAEWVIAGGSRIKIASRYLDVHGVSISSGIQRISTATNDATGQLVLNIENIDVAQVGALVGLDPYQPDGRISGTVQLDRLFGGVILKANIRATGVKLGTDTLGTIHAAGYYDEEKKLIAIDPQTGIYRDYSSVTASGSFSLDTTLASRLNGNVVFHDAKVAWSEPFLVGLMSNLRGGVDGTVHVSWASGKPDINGTLTVSDAAFKMDYLGCYYTIPEASVRVARDRIDLGNITVLDRYKNKAIFSGYFSHDMFYNVRMRLKATTEGIEVLNLARGENDLFYGHVFARMDSFNIRGPFNNIRLNLHNGEPSAKSVVYIPASTGGYTGAYNYVSFKNYGTDQPKETRRSRDKISITMEANMNTLAEMHIVLDPATEDEIIAKGTGNILMEVPPDNDLRMNGVYTINEGTYKLTFAQLYLSRQFRLNPGSTIAFNGAFAETNLAVNATYSTKARLYDLLSENERTAIKDNRYELIDAQTPQWINVQLHMNGPIYNSRLTFDLDLENKSSQSTLAYRKLMLLNNDDRQKFDQVAALLLVNSFLPPEGNLGSAAGSGAINNFSQILSNTASQGLQKVLNKLIGERNLNVAVKYTNYNYNYNDQVTAGSVNRNQLKVGLTKNYLNDRLLVSVGSTSDWGRPTASSTSTSTNFNIAGDFRIQYLLSNTSGLRLNVFHTSDYDLTIDRNIQRSGVGISWRKSFDNLGEFFHGNKYARRQKQKQIEGQLRVLDSTEKVESKK